MKITSVDPIIIAVPYRFGARAGSEIATRWPTMDTLLVRVDTDVGVTGWGQAFGFACCATTRTALQSLIAPAVMGQDATDISRLMADLQRKLHNHGRNGPVLFGLSGLDIALWDIAGKVAVT